jgi:hypothetical protein
MPECPPADLIRNAGFSLAQAVLCQPLGRLAVSYIRDAFQKQCSWGYQQGLRRRSLECGPGAPSLLAGRSDRGCQGSSCAAYRRRSARPTWSGAIFRSAWLRGASPDSRPVSAKEARQSLRGGQPLCRASRLCRVHETLSRTRAIRQRRQWRLALPSAPSRLAS